MTSLYPATVGGYSGLVPLLGPLAAYLPTPRDENGRFLVKTFETLVDNAVTAGATAVGVLGSTGGFAYLPRSARKRVVRTAVEVADGRVPVIAGVGAVTLAEVAVNVEEAEEAGADALLLAPVSYQPLTDDEVAGLYRDVASRANVGIWVYNNPATTRYRFGADELAALGRMNGVVGFKDRAATASEARERRRRVQEALPPRTGRRLQHGFSGDGMGAQVLLDGAATWHSSIAGVIPEAPAAIARAVGAGQAAEARRLQRQLTSIAVLAAQYGGIRVAQALGDLAGLDMGALPRPLQQLPADARSILRMALRSIDVPDELKAASGVPTARPRRAASPDAGPGRDDQTTSSRAGRHQASGDR